MENFNKKFIEIYKSLFPDTILTEALPFYLKYVYPKSLQNAVLSTFPLSTRGVIYSKVSDCELSFKLNCLIDWLSVSFSSYELMNFFKYFGYTDSQFFNFYGESFRIRTKFYENSFKIFGTGTISNGLFQQGAIRTCLLDLTGTSIARFRNELNVTDFQILKAINYTNGNNIIDTEVKISRVDLTVDYESLNVISGIRFWENILKHIYSMSYVSSAKKSSVSIKVTETRDHVQTIYIGNRSSDRFLCMYLKHEESVDVREEFIENFVIRFELRLSESHAYSFRVNVNSCKNEQDFLILIRSTISDFIDFKVEAHLSISNIKNVRREKTADWWSKVFKDDFVLNRYPVYKSKSLDRLDRYIAKQAKSIYMREMIEPGYIEKVLDIGKDDFNSKYEKNVEEAEFLKEQLIQRRSNYAE